MHDHSYYLSLISCISSLWFRVFLDALQGLMSLLLLCLKTYRYPMDTDKMRFLQTLLLLFIFYGYGWHPKV